MPDFLFGHSDMGVPIGIIFCILALVFVVLAIQWARKNLDESKIPILAVIAAGIFALQAFNLPTGFGVSGHLAGGALAAIVLGSPFAAVFVLAIVLVIQALIFGDGGVLALGTNIINMGVVAGFVGFYSFVTLKKKLGVPVSAAVAGWLACVIAASVCAIEIAIVGAVPLHVGFLAMFIYHALIGIIEAVITGIVVVHIFRVRPGLSGSSDKRSRPARKLLVIGLVIALIIGCGAVFLASGDPDGLDSTLLVGGGAKEIFAPAHSEIEEVHDPVGWKSPMPDYVLGSEGFGGVIALVIGIFAALIMIFFVARLVYT
ncbi:MAG TPA: cobalt transporter CbiM, partial [Methanocorpusculum sp.]|nr:cobalt transporter CbiM [Methanocorpusculum sp.]